MKRCFVMSPIGKEGSPIREHADDVLDYIIRPAMQECGIECFRADHLQEPGRITEQMFREIFTADLCIAVLTGQNPNVFYELALAQAAARPLIALIEKSEELPFDIRDWRTVQYDLKPRSLFEKMFVRQIVAHIENIARLEWRVPSAFAAHGLGTQGSAGPRYFPRHQSFGTDEWLALLGNAEERIDLLSLTLDA
jgi:hypothetical protein